ncbi:ComEC/Rec2 family competence protein [Pedobacter sp. N23S346]|uniref:ComEC/Rec2 family competence protein n=1 Tax=Pedobacter sp. N23S346 TaxID=3402750 RepID=UPI003ACA7809
MASVEIFFLDVGQGDATFIKCPNGTKLLVDFGSKKNGDIAGADAVTFVESQVPTEPPTKTRYIDHLFLTHGDGDHYNLLGKLHEKSFKYRNVHIGGVEADYCAEVKTNVFTPAKFTGTLSIFGNCDGDAEGSPRWTFGTGTNKVEIYLLCANYPNATASDKNEKSLVLMLKYAGLKVILTGDAGAAVENYIVNTKYTANKAFLKSFGLKLGHHGSEGSSKEDWLKNVEAKAYFASADQKWGHPYRSVYDRVIAADFVRKVPEFKHGYVCGKHNSITKDYEWKNFNQSVYFFTNLYNIKTIVNPMAVNGREWEAYGTNYGLYIYDDGKVEIANSDDLKTNKGSSGKFKP